MAIGRAEDRESPGNPTMLRHREYVRDPIRVTHLGQRSIRPHTQAGHMTAIDQTDSSCQTLQTGGRPHMDSGLGPLFGEVSDGWTWVGAAIIAGAAIYVAHREAKLARLGRQATAQPVAAR